MSVVLPTSYFSLFLMSYFDHFPRSSTHIGRWLVRRVRGREISILRPFLPGQDCALLEIGAGTGLTAELLRQAGYRNYTAVEPNDRMREHLLRQGIVAKNYMIPSLAEADSSYDAILLVSVFEHLDGAREALAFFREARRVLRPGGVLCIVSPDYLHWRQDFYNCDFSHNNITSVCRTSQLFQDTGFRVLKYDYLGGFFTGIPATVVSYLARFGLFLATSNSLNRRLYRLKLTFLRRFLIVGARQPYLDYQPYLLAGL